MLIVQEASDCHLELVIDVHGWLCLMQNYCYQSVHLIEFQWDISSRLSAATAHDPPAFLSFTVSLPPSLSSCRIKLHLLQVFHHGGKRCDVPEDNEEEWVTHLFRLSWPLSAAFPPYPPTPSFLYPLSPPPPLSLRPLCPSLLTLFLYSPGLITLTIHPSLSCPSPSASLRFLAARFQVGHCLLSECLKSIPPTWRSSVSKLPSNLSFHWQLHNVLRSHSALCWMEKDRHMLKSHCTLVPHHCHAVGLNAVIE